MLRRLMTVVDEKIKEMDRTITLKNARDDAEVLALIRTNRGKALMDEANVFLHGIILAADERLTAAVSEQRANAAMLVLQLVAGRLLSPFIGSSLETWTSIIGVFLAGIALGNGFGGKLADRYPRPKTLAVLLGVGAIAALWMLLFPQLLTATGLHKSIPLGPRIPILAAALCLPAGLVLSLLTPLAIKLGLPDVAHTGRVAGLIFALSTLGCLIGNYVTGFYLIPAFFINTLVLAAAGALVALAGLSLVVVRPTPSTEGNGESFSPSPLA